MTFNTCDYLIKVTTWAHLTLFIDSFFITGKVKPYSVYANFCSDKLVAYSVLLIGYGMFGDLMHLVDQHRWMRKLRYFGKHNTEENILRDLRDLPISQ